MSELISRCTVLVVSDKFDDDKISELRQNLPISPTGPVSFEVSSNDKALGHNNVSAIIFTYAESHAGILTLHRAYPSAFICVYDADAATNPRQRLSYFDNGANMVTAECVEIIKVLNETVLTIKTGWYSCPFCGMSGLSEADLWLHCPAFHINSKEENLKCPICDRHTEEPTQAHIHHCHLPRLAHPLPSDRKVPLYSFSLVVCRHPTTGKFLLCQEFADQGFWLPGGAVDYGEKLTVAAIREAIEEAGVEVELKGILGMEQHNGSRYSRQRVVFYAEPMDPNQVPKSLPDFESAGACWCTEEEILGGLRLRGREPMDWVLYLRNGGAIHPMSLLQEF